MTARILEPRGGKRRRLLLGPVLLVSLVALIVAAVAQAVHDDNLFELGPAQGANILGDGNAANGPDWGDLFDANGDSTGNLFGGLAATFLNDETAQKGGLDSTTFSGAGGSNKNNDPISTADCAARVPPLTGSACDTWHWDAGNVPAKDDLVNSYVYATMPTSGPLADHLILYGGLERLDESGDSHVDFEFLQNSINIVDQAVSGDDAIPCNDPLADPTPCEFSGIRELNDVIVSMDFVQGGGIGSVEVRRWNGNEYELEGVGGGEGCNVADTICAFNNGTTIDGGPWPNFEKDGDVVDNLLPNAFTEIGVDVTALLGTTPCISTVMDKTRSSQSFTAELKDFSAPESFPICGGRISIEPDDVNAVGDTHTFTVNVAKTIGNSEEPAPDGTIVDVTLTDANGAAVTDVVDNCATTGTVNGSCTVSFTSNTAGTVTAHAEADIDIDGTTIHVETDGVSSNSGDAVKRFVDAKISIGPDDTNAVGDSHTFTVSIQQDDGLAADQGGDGVSGFGPAPDGTHPVVTLTDSNGAISNISSNTCALAGTVNGSCSVTFTSNSAGQVTGHASVTFSVGGVSLTRETDNTGGSTGNAVKRFVDARISIAPDDTNEVGDSHTFTVTVEQNDGLAADEGGDGVTGFGPAPDGTTVVVTLTDANGALTNVSTNTCGSVGTVGGECTVTFTSNTAGTITGHAAVTFSVGGVSLTRQTDDTAGNSGDAVKRFVDAKISIAPDDTNSVGESHTFTVTVEQNDGLAADQGGDGVSGFGPAPDGTTVTVTLTGFAIDVVDTCGGIGTIDGQCTVTFTSNVAGPVIGHASATFAVGGVSLTRATNGVGGNSGDATKVFVAGSITWRKVDNADHLQGGATFEVCRTANLDTSTDPDTFVDIDPDVCVTVVDDVDGTAGGTLDEDPDPGEFRLGGLRLGRYTVDETVAPPGFEPDPNVATVELTLADPDATIATAFRNERPILKITGFGYTNEATGTPTAGVVSGTATYTVDLHNYGGAAATLTSSSLVVDVGGAGAGTLTCGANNDPAPFTQTITGTVGAGANLGPVTVTCHYDDMADGAVITAALNVNYTTNGLERAASGSPATISFTVQSD
jgi:Prealbumin-like fold domain